MTQIDTRSEPIRPPAEHRVVVLGASPNPDRYSNRAVQLLKAHGYLVVPVHPRGVEVDGIPTTRNLQEVTGEVHTLTLYVGPQRSAVLTEAILEMAPQRVIFNPGSESPDLEQRLVERDVECIRGCTLVMLRTGQF